jgi:Recombinase
MEQASEGTRSRRNGIRGTLAGKRAADSRTLALLPTIRMLIAAGFVSHRGLACELNRRAIPAAGGGRWHRNTVLRMLRRLDLLTLGQDGIDNGLTSRRVADVRAEAFGPTIRKLRKAGFVSVKAIARELNKRGIPTPRGGKWHLTTVTRLLQRLERLDRASNGRYRR